MNFNKSKKLKGFTLIELLMVLGIIAVITVGIFMLAKHVNTNREVTQEMNRMMELTKGLDNAYVNTVGYDANLSVNTAINNGAVPMDLLTGTQILDSWGQPITLSVASYNGNPTGAANIVYPQVSTDVCSQMVSNLMTRFAKITVGSNVVKSSENQVVSPSVIAQDCQGNPSVTLTYVGAGVDATATGNPSGTLPGGTSGTQPPPVIPVPPPVAVPIPVSQAPSVAALNGTTYVMPCIGNTNPAYPNECATPTAQSSSTATGKTVGNHPSGYMSTGGVIGVPPSAK